MKRIAFTVEEPLILDYRYGVSNEHDTMTYIPGSRVRGALYEALGRSFTPQQSEKLFGFASGRWTCAWPAGGENDDSRWRPLPKCPPEGHGAVTKGTPIRGWGSIDGSALVHREVPTEVHMGLSRDYQRLAHRHGALYARTTISRGQKFIGYIEDPANILDQVLEVSEGPQNPPTWSSLTWNVGTRRSANGRCTIRVEKVAESAISADCQNINGSRFTMQLLSDAIIPGAMGGYCRGLDEDALAQLSGLPAESITICDAYSSSRIVGGWSGQWNLPRDSAIAIEAGSVWVVQIHSRRDEWITFIDNAMTHGLGARGYEGFGTIAINPIWLNDSPLTFKFQPHTTTTEIRRAVGSVHDPLAPHVPLLLGLAQSDASQLTQGHMTTVRDWITYVSRDVTPDAVLDSRLLKTGNIVASIKSMPPALQRDAALLYLSAVEVALKHLSATDEASGTEEEH